MIHTERYNKLAKGIWPDSIDEFTDAELRDISIERSDTGAEHIESANNFIRDNHHLLFTPIKLVSVG